MPLYMSQFAYSPEARAALTRNPENRTEVLTQLADRLGARLVNLYYSFGDYDGVFITEAPDDVTAAAVVLAAMGPGHVKAVKTVALLTAEQAVEAMRKAGSVSYRGPKQPGE